MGSYLSRPPPRPPSPATLDGELPDSPESLGPAHGVRRGPHAARVSSTAPTPGLDRRMSHEDPLFWPRRLRQHRRRRGFLLPRRPCLLQQARGLLPGSWARGSRRAGPGAGTLCAALVLQTVAARGRRTVLCVWASLSGQRSPARATAKATTEAVGGDAKATPPQRDLPAPVEGGEGHRPQDAPAPEAQRPQPVGASDGSGVGRSLESAFRRLMSRGALASFVPRPGPLRLPHRGFPGDRTEPGPLCRRNAISSSYSSTRGLLPPHLRLLVGPAGPPDGAGEDSPRAQTRPPSASPERVPEEPPAPDAPTQGTETAAPPSPQPSVQGQQEPGDPPQPAMDAPRPRKRKVCLLRPCRPNEPLILPPAPQPGYPVTSEDLDAEKRAALQWINRALEG